MYSTVSKETDVLFYYVQEGEVFKEILGYGSEYTKWGYLKNVVMIEKQISDTTLHIYIRGFR